MATFLSDREIRGLLTEILPGSDPKLLNPNGIELRLGAHVRFLATGEDKQLKPGDYLKVAPGETVLVSSLEKIDFRPQTIHKHYPNSSIMGLITPTTTMMREGISQVSTKVDAGYRGYLNWSIRNASTKDFLVEYGEPLYKLTVILLNPEESPATAYGDASRHQYQDTEGIMRSARRIAADPPKNRIVGSTFEKLDHRTQLKEAGYPFNHISTELTELHGKFEIVSKDVLLLKDQFEKQTRQLTTKIGEERAVLEKKIDENKTIILDKVSDLFSQKFVRIIGTIVGAIPILYAILVFLQKTPLRVEGIAAVSLLGGVVILVLCWLATRRG